MGPLTCLFAARRCRVLAILSNIHLYAPSNYCAASSLATKYPALILNVIVPLEFVAGRHAK